MKNSGFSFVTALAVVLLCIQTVNAQIVKRAQVGFRFLENPVSAEVMGKGGVGILATTTSNGIFWNPALLGWIERDIDASINYTNGIADINYNAAALSVRWSGFGTFGFSLLAMDYGTFYTTVRAATSDGFIETGEFSPTAMALGAAFAQKVNDRFSYGIHLKYALQDLGEAWVSTAGSSLNDSTLTLDKRRYSNNAYAADVGVYYDFLYNGIRFGATLQNISRERRYENEQFPLPFAVSFGLTVEPLNLFEGVDTTHSLLLAFESRHPRDFQEKVKFGAEYRFYDIFIARLGYQKNFDERSWTMGVGVRETVSDIPLRVDYAYEPFGIFGGVHFVSLGASY